MSHFAPEPHETYRKVLVARVAPSVARVAPSVARVARSEVLPEQSLCTRKLLQIRMIRCSVARVALWF